jgi:hypothetical protein
VPPDRAERFAWLVGAAVLGGLVLRIAIALTDDAPSTDETAYLRSGLSLIEGDGYQRDGQPELHFPPFVPLLLGLASRVVPDPHTGTVVLTCLASTALIVPLALLGRRIAGPTAGVATAWIAALGAGISTTLVNRGAGSEAVYMLLVVSSVWFVVAAADRDGHARQRRVLGAGALVGLAYLTRPEGLLVAVPLGVAVVALAVRHVRRSGLADAARLRRIRAGAPLVVAFAVPIAACVVPYAAYLHGHTGAWQLSAKTQDASIEAWQAVARADREARDRVLYALDDTGLHFAAGRSSLPSLVRDDPAGYAGIVGTNAGQLATAIVRPIEGQVLAWLLLPLPVWVLAAVGAWRWRRSKVAALLVAVAALQLATALAFFVQPRYLVVAVALVTPLAGAALAPLAPRSRPRARAGAAMGHVASRRVALVAIVALLVVSSVQAFRSEAAGWWHPADHTDQRRAGEWLAAHADPDDRIMTRSMVVEYYAGRPTMAIPYADLDRIVAYARHYGARYLVVDWYTAVRLRPQLEPLRTVDHALGLRLVHHVRAEGRTTRIFALDPAPLSDVPMGSSLGFVGDGQP